MTKQYKVAIVIGRFQPLHLGHKTMFDKAFEVAEKVMIFVGSANQPRTINNPFTYDERWRNLAANLEHAPTECVIRPLNDYIYKDDRWKKQIDDIISRENRHPSQICIVGGSKDEWYMKLFPELDKVVPENLTGINATDLREVYFKNYTKIKGIQDNVTPETFRFLKAFAGTKWYSYIQNEFAEIADRLKKYGNGPHLTCDNLIIKEGKVLLIKRKNHPGKGLWAIPGGFLNPGETFEQGAYRELQEETTASISFKDFFKYRVGNKIYDHPKRSVYTHIITSLYCVSLPNNVQLKVEAADDAEEVKLFPLSVVKNMKNQMYDDHHDIIDEWTGFEE